MMQDQIKSLLKKSALRRAIKIGLIFIKKEQAFLKKSVLIKYTAANGMIGMMT